MKYKASIMLPVGTLSQTFNTIKEAREWLDARNNNLEYTTTISELGENGLPVDWYFYTKGAE